MSVTTQVVIGFRCQVSGVRFQVSGFRKEERGREYIITGMGEARGYLNIQYPARNVQCPSRGCVSYTWLLEIGCWMLAVGYSNDC